LQRLKQRARLRSACGCWFPAYRNACGSWSPAKIWGGACPFGAGLGSPLPRGGIPMGESGAAPIASWRAPFYKRGSGPESAKNKLAPTWKSVLHCSRRRNLPVLVSFQCSLREVGEQLRAARALGTSSSCFAAVAGGGWLVIAVVLLSLPLCNSQVTSRSMTTPRHPSSCTGHRSSARPCATARWAS